MIALSKRFAPLAGALLGCAAVPILLHATLRPFRDDCTDPRAFFHAPRVAGAQVERAELPYVHGVEGIQGQLVRGDLQPFFVRVLRTFEPVLFYSRPAPYGFRTDLYRNPGELHQVEADGQRLPMHWHWNAWSDKVSFEAYGLVQGGMPVRHPLVSGLALAFEQLRSGTRPITLFIVSGAGAAADRETLVRDAERWFAQAWREFEATCGS